MTLTPFIEREQGRRRKQAEGSQLKGLGSTLRSKIWVALGKSLLLSGPLFVHISGQWNRRSLRFMPALIWYVF